MLYLISLAAISVQPSALPALAGTLSVESGKVRIERPGKASVRAARAHRLRVGDKLIVLERGQMKVVLDAPREVWALPGTGAFVIESKSIRVIRGDRPKLIRRISIPKNGIGKPPRGLRGVIRGQGAELAPAGAVAAGSIVVSWSSQSQLVRPIVEVVDSNGKLLWKQNALERTSLKIPESVTPPGKWVTVRVSSTAINELTVSTLVSLLTREQRQAVEAEENALRSGFNTDPVVLGYALGEVWAESRMVQRLPEALDLAFPALIPIVLPVAPGAVATVPLPSTFWSMERGLREWQHGRWLEQAGFEGQALRAYRRARNLGIDDQELVEAVRRLESNEQSSNLRRETSPDEARIERLIMERDRKVFSAYRRQAAEEAREVVRLLESIEAPDSEALKEARLWRALCEASTTKSDSYEAARGLAEVLRSRGQIEEAAAMEYYQGPSTQYWDLGAGDVERLERVATKLDIRFSNIRASASIELAAHFNYRGNVLASIAQLQKVIDVYGEEPPKDELAKYLLSYAHGVLGQLLLLSPFLNPARVELHLIQALRLNEELVSFHRYDSELLATLTMLYGLRPDFASMHATRILEETSRRLSELMASAEPDLLTIGLIQQGLLAALVSRGDERRALDLANVLVDYHERFLPRSYPAFFSALSTRGGLKLSIEDVFGALADFERAAEIDSRSDQKSGDAQFSLAYVYCSLGRFLEARNIVARLEIRDVAGDPSTPILKKVAASLKDFLDALEGNEVATNNFLKLSPTSLHTAAQGLIGSLKPIVLIANGRYEEAQPLLLAQWEKARGRDPGSTDRLISTMNLAANLERLGRREEALQLLEDENATVPKRAGSGARLRSNYAMLHLVLRGSLPDVSMSQIAKDFASELREIAKAGNEQALVSMSTDLQGFLQMACWLTSRSLMEPSELYEVLLALRGLSTEGLIRQSTAERALRDDSSLRPSIERVSLLRRELARAVANVETSVEDRERMESDLRLSESVLNAKISELMDWQDESTDVRGVLGRLSEDTVIVELVRYRDFIPHAAAGAAKWGTARYGVVVVGRGAKPRWVNLATADEIETPIREWIRQIRNANAEGATQETLRSTEQELRVLGRTLYDKLIRPLGPLPANILFVPDGLLHRIPPGAFIGADGRFLLEKHAISILGTGRDLVLERPSAELGPPVVFAAPDYDMLPKDVALANPSPALPPTALRGLNREGDWPVLPEALREGESVASKLGVEVIQGVEATEQRFASLARPSVLHIATHGFFSETSDEASRNEFLLSAPKAAGIQTAESPMIRSGLVFAGANHEADLRKLGLADGWATALEVSQLDLRGTELVVLSGCDTGRGDAVGYEGIFGLQRSFRLAGARSLIMSLFKVPDAETRTLMESFYTAWRPGSPPGSKAKALRDAQLAMLKDPKTRHPRYWAGFVLMGER